MTCLLYIYVYVSQEPCSSSAIGVGHSHDLQKVERLKSHTHTLDRSDLHSMLDCGATQLLLSVYGTVSVAPVSAHPYSATSLQCVCACWHTELG